MIIFNFDQTFEGLLTLVFESYRLTIIPAVIRSAGNCQSVLFSETVFIPTEDEKAERVWSKRVQKTSKANAHRLFGVFLSELPDAPKLIFDYIRLMTEKQHNIETDFTLAPVLEIDKLYRKVIREVHRLHMFTRFQQTAENSYYASFLPRYNVLPLSIPHFSDRFADQEWIIYDLQRNYGFYYNLKETVRVTFDSLPVNPMTGQLDGSYQSLDEKQFQKLWKQYFRSVNIESRSNLKLHRQNLPQRFWRFLPEKSL